MDTVTSQSNDEAVKLKKCSEALADKKLRAVCDQLDARKAVPREPLSLVTECYRKWAASPLPQGTSRSTIYLVSQAREQLLLGLSRGGSTRGGAASLATTLVEGTRDFLAKRASEELSLFMLGVLRNRLCDRLGGEQKTPFPNICRVLGGSDTLPASSAALSRAARADLRSIPRWLVAKLVVSPDTHDLACALDIAQAFTTAAREGQPLFDVVTDDSVLSKLMSSPDKCKDQLAKLGPLIEATRVSRTYASFNALKDEGSYDLLVSLATAEMSTPPPTEASAEVLRRLNTVADVLTQPQLGTTLHPRVATAALGVLRPVLQHILSDKLLVDTLAQAMTALVREDYPESFVHLIALEPVRGSINGLSPSALRAFGITAEVAAANTNADVAVILEQTALPLGSWRRKDERRTGLTLSGFVGLHVNYEDVTQPVTVEGKEYTVADGAVLSPTAILGVDVHRGFGDVRIGILAPLLDFGSVASTRVSTSAGGDIKPDKGATVGIQQLLSPGGYLYFGYGPFVLAGGASWVPALRPATAAGIQETLSVLRIGGFVAVDVSIVPLL